MPNTIQKLNSIKKCHLTVGGFLINNAKLLLIFHPKIGKWLPVGGHIDENETPEEALIKEFKEEVGLEVAVLNFGSKLRIFEPDIRKQQPNPFYSEIHSVGDHIHHCQFFICKLYDTKQKVKVDGVEVNTYKWLSIQDIKISSEIHEDIKNLSVLAFDNYKLC